MTAKSPAQLREEIKKLVEEFYVAQHKPMQRFDPANPKVHYAGRVFDEKEMVAMVDSTLDFWLTHGQQAEKFESELAKFLGATYALLTNSGSSANLLAVSALMSPQLANPLKPGDEVITPALTFPTTLAPILQNGLIPVFVDIDPATYNIDATKIEAAIGPRTRAMVLPHTLGNPLDLSLIAPLAKSKNMFLIEDTCDALGATFDGKRVGTFGDIATLSFYPAHHMTLGEGGAMYTSNSRMKRILMSLRDWGRDCWCAPGVSNTCKKRFDWELGDLPRGYDHKYIYTHIGYNLKALDPQAAMGLEQLKKVPGFVAARKKNFARLYKGLEEFQDVLLLPSAYKGADPSWFAMPLTVKSNAPFTRRDLVAFLEQKKIETRMIFGGNILRQPAFQSIPRRISGDLTHTDNAMMNSFFVGVYPGLTDAAVDYMIACFREFILKGAHGTATLRQPTDR